MQNEKGFSLIELIAVMVIIAVIVGGAGLAITSGDQKTLFNDQVERFVAYAEHGSELAAITGESVALFLEPPEWQDEDIEDDGIGWRYSWKVSSFQGWNPIDALPVQDFDERINLLVLINEQAWEYENAPEVLEPIVEFSPSGDVTPFEIEFTHEELIDEVAHVEINVWGEISWRERAEDMEELREYLDDDE